MANPHVNDMNMSQLEEELVKCKSDLKKAFSEGVMTGVSPSLLPPASHFLPLAAALIVFQIQSRRSSQSCQRTRNDCPRRWRLARQIWTL